MCLVGSVAPQWAARHASCNDTMLAFPRRHTQLHLASFFDTFAKIAEHCVHAKGEPPHHWPQHVTRCQASLYQRLVTDDTAALSLVHGRHARNSWYMT